MSDEGVNCRGALETVSDAGILITSTYMRVKHAHICTGGHATLLELTGRIQPAFSRLVRAHSVNNGP
jgi:hypothetical protein